MNYKSIETLQATLKDSVFNYAADARKAAGRSLGTMIEIITYYMLRDWGYSGYTAIERGLPEYRNSEITHNVEFTLHPICQRAKVKGLNAPLTSSKIMRSISEEIDVDAYSSKKGNSVLDSNDVLRNSCLLAENNTKLVIANLVKDGEVDVSVLHQSPFCMIECKRVGVEEGCKKGPQTIEKAKQGAYVAQMTSSLQKVWSDDGKRLGFIYNDGKPIVKPYDELLEDVVDDNSLLHDFILSVGIVSNHGNWFTAENQNKEMKVLAQAYDWLLFLTDEGLSTFVEELLLNPQSKYKAVREAFTRSYPKTKGNEFTKTKISKEAHEALCNYFATHRKKIEKWFNVIAPANHCISDLRNLLFTLANKKWEEIL